MIQKVISSCPAINIEIQDWYSGISMLMVVYGIKKIITKLEKAILRSPVVSLVGPRQCGKTTLARLLGNKHKVTYFDLESIPDQRRLQNPELMPLSLEGMVILDKIQNNA